MSDARRLYTGVHNAIAIHYYARKSGFFAIHLCNMADVGQICFRDQT